MQIFRCREPSNCIGTVYHFGSSGAERSKLRRDSSFVRYFPMLVVFSWLIWWFILEQGRSISKFVNNCSSICLSLISTFLHIRMCIRFNYWTIGWVNAYVVIIIPSRCKHCINNFVVLNCSTLGDAIWTNRCLGRINTFHKAKFRRRCFISREGDRLIPKTLFFRISGQDNKGKVDLSFAHLAA